MKTILGNIKHIPSSLAGLGAIGVGLILAHADALSQIATVDPKLGKYITAALGIASGLGLILGVGPKAQ